MKVGYRLIASLPILFSTASIAAAQTVLLPLARLAGNGTTVRGLLGASRQRLRLVGREPQAHGVHEVVAGGPLGWDRR